MPGSMRLCGGFSDQRENDRDGENRDDHGERRKGADLDPVGGEHLERGEGEDRGQAVVQEAQLREQWR